MAYLRKFKSWLFGSIDGHVLGAFRIIFGLFMAYEAWVYLRVGLIEQGLLAPQILFKYDGLGWLHPFSAPAMYAILAVMGLSGLLIAAGVMFRWACWAFALSLAFIFLQEKSYYNNHIYLFILLGVMLSFTHADHFLSLRRKAGRFTALPRWQQFIFQAQFVIVYFYGGLTKLKLDWWIRKEPITSMVNSFPSNHWLAPFFKTDFSIGVLTYGGLLLDILAPLLLWYKPVRRWAMIPFAAFHLANGRIFDDIGIFPYVMLCSLILFFETKELPLLRKWASPTPGVSQSGAPQPKGASQKSKTTEPLQPSVPVTPAWMKNVLVGFFAFQLLFPFRGFFLPNKMDWTGIGKNFSWRMKVDTRSIEEMTFTVHNPVNGQVSPVNVGSFVNQMQILNMANDVRSVAAFARKLRDHVARQGMPGAVVKARIRVRYNGRPPQLLVNPDVDLASVTYSPFRKLDWVIPFQE